LNLLIALLKYIGDMPAVDYLGDMAIKKPTASLSDLPELLQVIIESFSYFINILQIPSKESPQIPTNEHNNFSTLDNFGYIRLRLIQVFTILLGLNFPVVNNHIFDSEILNISLDLVFTFPQNNFAHQAIEGLWSKAFEVAENENCVKILSKTSIIKRLITAENENTAAEQAGLLRRPYMPYLHQLAFALQSLTHPEVKGILDQTEGWGDYITLVELRSVPITERQRRGGTFRI